jgi:ureidoacrylate peracid hydrolase
MPPELQVLRTLEEKIRPGHVAVIVVDMQNDFCDTKGVTAVEGGRDVTMAQSIIPAIKRLAAGCRDANGLVVYVKTSTLPDNGSHSGPWVDARSRATYSSINICMEGTWGQELAGGLEALPGDVVVRKHRYSGFSGTDLDMILRSHGVKTIIVTGCSTNACVETTLRAGFELDYYVVVPSDACASWNVELHHATLENVRHRFGVVSTVDEILDVWGVNQSK